MSDLNKIMIQMDLPRLGELTAHIAAAFAQQRDIEPPDWEGQEGRDLALAAWHYVVQMHDRAEFARSVQKDLAELGTSTDVTQSDVKPLGWNPPV